MTKLSYDIKLNGTTIKNVTSYQEAKKAVAQLGKGASMKAVYTPFNSEDTPKKRKNLKEHAKKFAEKRGLEN